jgi:ATP-binding cassette, subfamily B, bacterial
VRNHRSDRDAALYRRLLLEARPFWLHIGGIFLLGLVSSGLALLVPLPLKIAVDSVIGSHPVPSFLGRWLPSWTIRSDDGVLAVTAGLFVLIAILQQLQEFTNLILTTYTGERLTLRFRSRIFAHVQRLSIAYQDSKGASDSAYRIQYDAPVIRDVAIDGAIPFVTSTVTIAGMIYITARIDWQLAVVALAVTPALLLTLKTSRSRLRAQWRTTKRLESSALAVVEEVLGALRVVKAYGQEARAQERFERLSKASIRAHLGASFAEGALGVGVGTVFAVGTAAVLFIGARRVRSGALTLGDLLLVLGYLSQLYAPLKTMSKKYGDLQSSLASGERTFNVLDRPAELREPPDARSLGRSTGAIEVRDVCFEYEEGQPILEHVSLEIPKGTRVGIVGATGAGKTTLINLLVRFYDPTTGSILLDGVDLRDYRLVDLRNQFAVVLQDPVLFSATILENIAYARPECRTDEVVKAAVRARAHGFIRTLPRGYLTHVGARGMRLSGGERQRVALARAFLKDAPILLLDEPTSAVDAGTETEIMEAIDALSADRTTVMISHRPSTLAGCDRLLRVENGVITPRSQARRSYKGASRRGTPATNGGPFDGQDASLLPRR